MKRTISDEEAKEHFGIVAAHEQMPNGELRFRLFGSDGNGYIRTVATETGGWQKSHLHSTFRELYLVEFGWMAMATLGHDPNIPEIRIFHPGTQCISPLGQIHNVYLTGRTVIYTIKFGIRGPTARFEPSPEFDLITHPLLSEVDIMRLASSPRSN